MNLKKDETIIDFSYRVSDDKLNQAIWFLDDKLQIWKCVNELNPNSSNWTLIKVTMFDYLPYRQFIQPSMTYDEFYISSIMNKLCCFKKMMPDDQDNFDFIFRYNMSSTRLLLVMQPFIESEMKLLNSPPYTSQDENIEECIERRLGFTQASWRKLKTRVMLISKKQQIIITQITEKKTIATQLVESVNKTVTNLRNQIQEEMLKQAQRHHPPNPQRHDSSPSY